MEVPTAYQKYSTQADFPAKLFVQGPLVVIDKIAPQVRLLADEAAFIPDMALPQAVFFPDIAPPQDPAMVSVTQIQKALLTDHWHLNDASCHSPSDPPDLAIFDIVTATKV